MSVNSKSGVTIRAAIGAVCSLFPRKDAKLRFSPSLFFDKHVRLMTERRTHARQLKGFYVGFN